MWLKPEVFCVHMPGVSTLALLLDVEYALKNIDGRPTIGLKTWRSVTQTFPSFKLLCPDQTSSKLVPRCTSARKQLWSPPLDSNHPLRSRFQTPLKKKKMKQPFLPKGVGLLRNSSYPSSLELNTSLQTLQQATSINLVQGSLVFKRKRRTKDVITLAV